MYHPRLKGTHYEMGKHYGEILKKTGEDLSTVINLTEEQRLFGQNCLPIYEKYCFDIMNEVRGLADGLGKSYLDIAYWLFSLYCFESDHGCSVFACRNKEEIYFARNMDMFPEYKKTSESVLYRPTNKNTFIAHSTAMISVEDGMNEFGLAAALTFILPKQIKQGINGGFIVRKILEECKTTKEAITLLETIPFSSTHNIIIADKTGNFANIECCAEKHIVRYNDQFVVATNHFLTPLMKEYNPEDHNWYETQNRYNTIDKCLSNDKEISFDKVKRIIAGEYGMVCQYEKKLHFDTIWSCVYNLTTLYNEVCEGNPSKQTFKEDNRLLWGILKK